MERDAYFDNVKVLLIFLVVLGHAIEPLGYGPIYLWIYSFHIPLFVFVSGYFSKGGESADLPVRVISRLVIPYFLFEVLYSLYDFWLFGRKTLEFSVFTPYWLMWFLFSLIIWKVALPYLARIKWVLPLSIVAGIAAGYAGSIGYYSSISRTIVFLPFFLAGYYFDAGLIARLSAPACRILAAVVLTGAFLFFLFVGKDMDVHWLYGTTPYAKMDGVGNLGGIYRLGLYGLTAVVGLGVLALVPSRRIPFVTAGGRNTFYAYLLHGFIIKFMVDSRLYRHVDTPFEKVMLALLAVAITAVFSLNIVRKLFRPIIEPRLDFMFVGRQSR